MKTPPSPKAVRYICYALSIALLAVMFLLYTANIQLLNKIEGGLLDTRFKLRGAIPTSGQVVMVAVDEKSLDRVGRWPWTRSVMAELISAIHAKGAAVIAMDIVFSEPETVPYMSALEQSKLSEQTKEILQQWFAENNPDEKLAVSIKRAGNVLTAYFFHPEKQKTGNDVKAFSTADFFQLLKSGVDIVKAKTPDFPLNSASEIEFNIRTIAKASPGGGFFNFTPGLDGVVRHAPLLMRFRDEIFPSQGLKSVAEFMGAPIVLHAEEFGVTGLFLAKHAVPVNEQGSLIINYRGPAGTLPTYSAWDVLNGAVSENALNGKIVFLGVTALGVFDAHSTPFDPSFPGLEIQANVADNVLLGNPIQHSSLDVLASLIAVFLIVFLHALYMPRVRRDIYRLAISLAIIFGYMCFNYYAFVTQQLWLNLTYPLVAWFLSYLSLTAYLSFGMEQRYSTVRSAFKSYLHPELVDRLTHDPKLLELGCKQENLSVLFSDIRSFTNISESLTPPEVEKFLNCYMEPMTRNVLDNNGTLDKYIGDAVMAIYGAPVPSENNALDACKSAIDMIHSLEKVALCCPELDIFPIRIGIGVHTGDMMVGNLGSSFRFNYTVIGDNVNLASRLESLCKYYGVVIIVSEVTKKAIPETQGFVFRRMDTVQVKGKDQPVTLYELWHNAPSADEKVWLLQWDEALTLYETRAWESALVLFQTLFQQTPEDKVTEIYIQRCQQLLAAPPEDDWQAITRLTKK